MTSVGDTISAEVSDRLQLAPQPRVSVVMAVYNQEAYLAESVQGVLGQKVDFNFELLIGDDCSTDGTLALALRLQSEHPRTIRVISGHANVGLLVNYGRLIRACVGEFIASCDGDDVWTDPHKLRYQVDCLRTHADVGAVHTEFDHILWRNGRWQRLADYQKHRYGSSLVPQGNVFAELLRRNFMQISTVCFRGDLVRAAVEDGALKAGYSVNDWPLCLHVAARSAIVFVPKSTTLYRKVSGSMTNTGYAGRVRLFAGQIAMIKDVCDRFEVGCADRTDALTRLYRPLLSAALFAGDDANFSQTLAWLRDNDPAYARSWRGRLLPRLARSSIARAVLRRIQDARVRRRELREYR